ncbi:MAG: hypothetical protein ACK56I_12310, partial [bacterium]
AIREGFKRDPYIGCESNSVCKRYFDSKKATTIELIPQADGYYSLKTSDGYCLTHEILNSDKFNWKSACKISSE